jgi:pimeloyl-ACP methyl ester carboxylesterase
VIPPVTYEARGSGADAIVLLHGIGGDARSFQLQLDALSRTRRAIAWNMPGYSGSPAVSSLSFADLASALEELMDRLNIDRADLFGHSIGGMVALEFAATRPGRVRSLILCATTPSFGSKDGSFEEQFLKARLGPLDAGKTMADVAASAIPAVIGPDADPAGVALVRQAMSDIPPEAYRTVVKCLVTFDRRPSLGGIAAPALLIAGERDPNAAQRTMAKMAEKMPHARFVEIAGAGHLLPYERPTEVNRLVVDFLREIERDAA